ncbi:uncharacterized protein [Primulina eburnea]|uniref:uncharacterized protein n=1 Tax=Primulina eburnea TaxID=1245227 RepID=UPI003C6C7CDF
MNLPMEGASNSGTELPGSSEIDGQLVLALRKMMEKEMEVVVINTFHRLILPIMEDLISKVVKEEIQSAVMTHGLGNRTHEATMSTENRTLQLKFLDEVSLPVLTGKEIEGKGGTAMRLAIVNNMTGQLVTSGPEASAKVEILLLQADDDDNEHNWSTEDFDNKIIRESDEEKPHVAKGMYVRLKEGVAILSDVKLGHGSIWKKRCSCRLGARFVDNSNGSKVKQAWTESFTVEDRRGKLYGKHHPPFLSDEVWRLEKIGKERCKRLSEENIKTVRDFLFSLSADPQKLKRVFGCSKEWKATVEHARTCNIDDKKISLYRSPTKFNYIVAFDVVPQLLGIVRDSHYVRLDNLCEVEQANARELFLLALENRKDITSVDDETSLLQQFPYESCDICVATDSVRNDEYAPIEPDTGPSMCPSNKVSLIVSERMQQICDPSLPVPDQGPSSSTSALGYNQALGDPSLTVPHQGPSSLPFALGFNQALCDPSLAVPDQGPSSSLIPLGSNQALCDPSLIVPYQGTSSSLIPLGSNQRFCDPSLIVPYNGPSYSLIPPGSCQALCDPSVIAPDQPIYSPIDLGLYQALYHSTLTLPDQGPIYPLNDLGSNQALCDPSFTVPDQGPIYSLIALGSYQASCNPYSTVWDQGQSSSLFALGSKHALHDASLSLHDQGPSSSVIALGSYQASSDPSLTVPEQASSDRLTDLNDLFEHSDDNELISLFYHHNNKNSKTHTKSHSVQRCNAGSIRFFAAVGLTMWVSRVRKRVMGSCDFDVQKRQRIC